MRDNKLKIEVNVPVEVLFAFTITPPNSTLWLGSTVKEVTNELPVKTGTIYTLTDEDGSSFSVKVTQLKDNELVEWATLDDSYHCQYTYRKISDSASELEYYEWVKSGSLDSPFKQQTLEKLKQVLETQA